MPEISNTVDQIPTQPSATENLVHQHELLVIKASTFEEAMKFPKILKPETMLGIVNSDLAIDANNSTNSVKHWLDQAPLDELDNDFAESSEAITTFHTELTEIITNNFKVAVTSKDPDVRSYVSQQKVRYLENLHTKDEAFAKKVESFSQGEVVRGMSHDADYSGFLISSESGNVDISNRENSRKIAGIRTNITCQTEIAGSFIHWETDKRIREKLEGNATELTHRIYLNPLVTGLCETFEEVMTALGEAGLEAHGKILDRSVESVPMMHEDRSKRTNRVDGIVLYVSDAEADTALEAVIALAQDNPTIFKGRKIPKVTQKITDGIGIGDEPHGVTSESLTSHRAGLLAEVSDEIRTQLGIASGEKVEESRIAEVSQLFENTFIQKASEANVDPYNLAFHKVA